MAEISMVDVDPMLLSEEEISLLLAAFKYWSKPDEFTDEQVSQAKSIFQRVFSDDSLLKGGEFSDSLVLQPLNDPTLFYAMVVGEDRLLTWKKAYVNATNFQILNSRLTSFDTFLSIVGNYCTPEYDDDDDALSFLHGFFKYWHRKFSLERIARVAQKAGESCNQRSNTSGEILSRTTDTLMRMRWELRLLGFDEEGGGDNIEEGSGDVIYFNWIDPEALAAGFAPQSFTVSFTDDDYEEDGLCEDGVFVNEMYGHSTNLRTWDEWDEFLIGQMNNCI